MEGRQTLTYPFCIWGNGGILQGQSRGWRLVSRLGPITQPDCRPRLVTTWCLGTADFTWLPLVTSQDSFLCVHVTARGLPTLLGSLPSPPKLLAHATPIQTSHAGCRISRQPPNENRGHDGWHADHSPHRPYLVQAQSERLPDARTAPRIQ